MFLVICTVDVASTLSNCYQFLRRLSEMQIIYRTAEKSPLFHMLHNNLPTFGIAVYGLVVALNLNVLMSPPTLINPVEALYYDMWGDSTQDLSRTETSR